MKNTKHNNTKSTAASGSTNPLAAAGDNADEDYVVPLVGEEAFDTAYGDLPAKPAVTVPVEPRPETASTPNQPSNATAAFVQDHQRAEAVNVPANPPKDDPPIHPIAALFPTVPEGGLTKLAEGIRINGLAHDIVMHDGQIVDGRNRLLACRRAGVQPRFVEWREIYTGDMSLVEWIWSQNARRRHMTPVQLAAGYLVLFGQADREAASLARVAGNRRGGQTAGRSRRKQDRSMSNSTPTYLRDSRVEDAAPDEPPPDRGKRAHCRRKKLAEEFNISLHTSKLLLDVETARPDLLPEIVQGRLTISKATKLAFPSDLPEAPGTIDPDLKPVITKAVRAVEKLLARVPEQQRDEFKAAVAETVRKLP